MKTKKITKSNFTKKVKEHFKEYPVKSQVLSLYRNTLYYVIVKSKGGVEDSFHIASYFPTTNSGEIYDKKIKEIKRWEEYKDEGWKDDVWGVRKDGKLQYFMVYGDTFEEEVDAKNFVDALEEFISLFFTVRTNGRGKDITLHKVSKIGSKYNDNITIVNQTTQQAKDYKVRYKKVGKDKVDVYYQHIKTYKNK